LRVLTDSEAIFVTANSGRPYVFPYSPPNQGQAGQTVNWLYSLQRGPDKITVAIIAQPVRDGLSGLNYQYRAMVNLNGARYEGFAFRQGEKPSGQDMP
jgi:uncharacterized membrane protein